MEISIILVLVVVGILFFVFKKKTPQVENKLETKTETVSEKPVVVEAPKVSWAQRLSNGLAKSRSEIWGKISTIVGSNLNDEELDKVEEILYTSDMSSKMIQELLTELKKLKGTTLSETDFQNFVFKFLKDKMEPIQKNVREELFTFDKNAPKKLKVIMIIGVNGVGKTTTIGKLATKLQRQGATVLVGACDTFRAAAVEQLEVWCNRANVGIVKAKEGADPSGVAFEAVQRAVQENVDYCIIDTAGRLHTKTNLMDELSKTKKVMSKVLSDAPHETLLVLDAITGQNALKQAIEFNKSLQLSGLIFTKCDGSAKAGSAVSIVNELNVPITYIGVGEDVDDLNIFDLEQYLKGLIGISLS
jgi:fused signal recognition particle receptor